MKTKGVLLLLVLAAGVIAAPLCWARETCFNYIVAYSFRDQVVYYTPIFTGSTKSDSYNEEEYVSDTATVLKMESAFQKYVTQNLKVKSKDLTVSARVAFKTEEFAKKRMDKEIDNFRFRGFALREVSQFKYDD